MFWASTALVTGLIVYASVQVDIPYLVFPLEWSHADKVGHAMAYAALTWSAFGGFRYAGGAVGHRHAAALAPLAALVLGIACESWQIALPRRQADVLDLCANMAGALLALTVWHSPLLTARLSGLSAPRQSEEKR